MANSNVFWYSKKAKNKENPQPSFYYVEKGSTTRARLLKYSNTRRAQVTGVGENPLNRNGEHHNSLRLIMMMI